MLRIGVALAVWLFAFSALARAGLKFDPPEGNWQASQEADGQTLFAAQGKRASAKIALHPAEPAPEGAAQFARELAQSKSPEFTERSEVQTFTSPDGRAVVAVDGRMNAGKSPARQCWIFDHGQRVLAEYSAGNEGEFKRREGAFMAFVASVKVEPDASQPAPSVSTRPQPAAPAGVDATLTFQAPSGWKRTDVANAVWLAAPVGADHLASYILLTPAEKLSGDFGAWYEHKLVPGPGVAILSRGKLEKSQIAPGWEAIRQRLSLQIRGRERHEQDVLAIHKGAAVALVALDAASDAALQAREPEFQNFLRGLDIRPDLTGPLPQVQVQPASAQPQAAFPNLNLPSGWTLTSQTPAWRTYSAPGSNAQGYAIVLVSQVTAAGDAQKTLDETRKGLGLAGPRGGELVPLADGRKVFRATDPLSGPVPATQTIVLSRDKRQVILIYRANRNDLFSTQQATFDKVVGGLQL